MSANIEQDNPEDDGSFEEDVARESLQGHPQNTSFAQPGNRSSGMKKAVLHVCASVASSLLRIAGLHVVTSNGGIPSK